MTIAIEMVVPILVGVWIDRRLGTKGLFAILGGVMGMTVGIWSLMRLVESLRRPLRRPPKRHESPDKLHP